MRLLMNIVFIQNIFWIIQGIFIDQRIFTLYIFNFFNKINLRFYLITLIHLIMVLVISNKFLRLLSILLWIKNSFYRKII